MEAYKKEVKLLQNSMNNLLDILGVFVKIAMKGAHKMYEIVLVLFFYLELKQI